MSDVLKQVEAALVAIRAEVSAGCHPDEPVEEIKDGIHFEPVLAVDAALTALRGLDWKEIAELDDSGHQPFYAGRWLDGEWDWSILRSRSFSMACGYTHFYRPVLPTPPKREGN